MAKTKTRRLSRMRMPDMTRGEVIRGWTWYPLANQTDIWAPFGVWQKEIDGKTAQARITGGYGFLSMGGIAGIEPCALSASDNRDIQAIFDIVRERRFTPKGRA
jgi:hypothetical protein